MKNRKKAEIVKEKANELFKAEEFEEAEKKYTEALELAADMKVLYTNRALCRIRLAKFEEAIRDCDWALRIDEKCPKAISQTGHAYLALENFTAARQWYSKLPPKLSKVYLSRLNRAMKEKESQVEAKKMLENSKIGELSELKKMCESLARKHEADMFYEGGLILLGLSCTILLTKFLS